MKFKKAMTILLIVRLVATLASTAVMLSTAMVKVAPVTVLWQVVV